MIAVLARSVITESINRLNYLHRVELKILAGNKFDVFRQMEDPDACYTHLIIDLLYWGSIDDAIDVIARLQETLPNTKILVVAENLEPRSVFIRDIRSLGIPDGLISYDTQAAFRQWLCAVLLADGVITAESAEAEETAPESAVESSEIAAAPSETAATDAPPPSQVSLAEAQRLMLPKPAEPVSQGAVTLAVVGAGHRIGTSTQAMQLLHFLHTAGYKAALIEMHGGSSLLAYAQAFDDVKKYDDTHYRINGLEIYRGSQHLLQCRRRYTYLVLDYGAYGEMPDVAAYLVQGIKIVCCGAKQSETPYLQPIFDADDGTLLYFFSFVPANDQEAVKESMVDSAAKTYFVPHAPDYWSYCGKDDFYGQIIQPKQEPPHEPKGRWPFLRRFRKG